MPLQESFQGEISTSESAYYMVYRIFFIVAGKRLDFSRILSANLFFYLENPNAHVISGLRHD